jgi:uncharacterized protein (DUF849 family)
MLLKIALNGARSKTENRNIPQTLDEIEKDVNQLYKIGYNVFHIHCYDKKGNESMNPKDVSELVTTVKKISSKIQIGISTGDWIEPDLKERIKQIENWTVIPDFVSVNMIEDNVHEITKTLIKKGVLIEAGLNEKKAAEIFVRSNLDNFCKRILIEPEEEKLENALQTVSEIEKILQKNRTKLPILLHGFNSASWGLIKEAKMRGYDGRMGLEDTVFFDDGTKANNNLDLLNSAAKIVNTK